MSVVLTTFPCTQVVYSPSARELTVETVKPEKSDNKDKDEDDIDIDAI